MSVINGQSINALVSNNAWISKNSYASDGDYVSAQSTYQVAFPDTSKAHIYYNSTLKLFRFHDGANWNSISGTGSVITQGVSLPASPRTGDFFIYTGVNTLVVGLNTFYPDLIYYYTGSGWFEFNKTRGLTVLGQTNGQVFTNGVTGTINYNVQNNFFGGCLTSLGGGSYNVTKYGKYSISAHTAIPIALMVDVIVDMRPFINGVAQRSIGYMQDRGGASVAVSPKCGGTDTYILSPTDTFQMRFNQTTGSNRALFASATEVWLTMEFLGV